jgi:beta-N-acetylhexosaminidase
LGYQHLVVTDDLEMGAISKHCEIESAVVRAFMAGEDMLLICAHPDIIRRGYDALLSTARDGKLPKERVRGSLRRIAAIKGIVKPPLPLNLQRFEELSAETARLNEKLNYRYGGTT